MRNKYYSDSEFFSILIAGMILVISGNISHQINTPISYFLNGMFIPFILWAVIQINRGD